MAIIACLTAFAIIPVQGSAEAGTTALAAPTQPTQVRSVKIDAVRSPRHQLGHVDSMSLTSTVNDRTLDVVYNSTSGLWACCTNATSNVQCYSPFKETFDAPPPQSLSTLFHIPATGFSPTSQQVTATSTTSSSTPLTTSSSTSLTTSSGAPASQHFGLSTGAEAGIGVGVSLIGVGIIVIALLLLILLRRQRSSSSAAARPIQVEARSQPVTEVPAPRAELAN